MGKPNMIQKLQGMPVPILPTTLGAITLSNVYGTLGYSFVKTFFNVLGSIILFYYILKIINHFDTVKKEYSNTVPASLYAAFNMILMLISVFYASWIPAFKYVFYLAVTLHAIHILIFTYRNVIKNFNYDNFLPTWFVTYNGIMVSTVAGQKYLAPIVIKAIIIYGIVIYLTIIPFIGYKIYKKRIPAGALHSTCITLAPCSLIVASYVVTPNANLLVASFFYVCLLLSLLYIIMKTPAYFNMQFAPGMAALTFPMAIGTLASVKMANYLTGLELVTYANFAKQVTGVQLFLTTAFISYVLFNFYQIFVNSYKAQEN